MSTSESAQQSTRFPGIEMGTHGRYVAIHKKARKFIAQTCQNCGTSERLQAALRPDAAPSRLRVSPKTGVLYSADVADYHALCPPCHGDLDSRVRSGQPLNHCMRGHEYTPETTYVPPGTADRVCRICKRDRQREYMRTYRALKAQA